MGSLCTGANKETEMELIQLQQQNQAKEQSAKIKSIDEFEAEFDQAIKEIEFNLPSVKVSSMFKS